MSYLCFEQLWGRTRDSLVFLSVSRVGKLWQRRSVTDSSIGSIDKSVRTVRGRSRVRILGRHIFHLPVTAYIPLVYYSYSTFLCEESTSVRHDGGIKWQSHHTLLAGSSSDPEYPMAQKWSANVLELWRRFTERASKAD